MGSKRLDAWNEVIDFLVSRPTAEQIVAFEGSQSFQEYVRELRDKNRNGLLTDEERHSMDEIGEIGRFMRRLKIRALETLAENEKLPQT